MSLSDIRPQLRGQTPTGRPFHRAAEYPPEAKTRPPEQRRLSFANSHEQSDAKSPPASSADFHQRIPLPEVSGGSAIRPRPSRKVRTPQGLLLVWPRLLAEGCERNGPSQSAASPKSVGAATGQTSFSPSQSHLSGRVLAPIAFQIQLAQVKPNTLATEASQCQASLEFPLSPLVRRRM